MCQELFWNHKGCTVWAISDYFLQHTWMLRMSASTIDFPSQVSVYFKTFLEVTYYAEKGVKNNVSVERKRYVIEWKQFILTHSSCWAMGTSFNKTRRRTQWSTYETVLYCYSKLPQKQYSNKSTRVYKVLPCVHAFAWKRWDLQCNCACVMFMERNNHRLLYCHHCFISAKLFRNMTTQVFFCIWIVINYE